MTFIIFTFFRHSNNQKTMSFGYMKCGSWYSDAHDLSQKFPFSPTFRASWITTYTQHMRYVCWIVRRTLQMYVCEDNWANYHNYRDFVVLACCLHSFHSYTFFSLHLLFVLLLIRHFVHAEQFAHEHSTPYITERFGKCLPKACTFCYCFPSN